MGSYGEVSIDGKKIFSFKSDVPPLFMQLFERSELRRTKVDLDKVEGFYTAEGETDEMVEFRISATVLRDRLAVLGVGLPAVEDALADRIQYRLDLLNRFEPPDVPGATEARTARKALLEKLDLSAWSRVVRDRFAGGVSIDRLAYDDPLSQVLELWDYVDPRYPLRCFVETFPEAEIVLDMTELVSGGWFDEDSGSSSFEAIPGYSSENPRGMLPIVLGEGKSDIRAMSSGLAVLFPHLVNYIRFPDFSQGPEGGAAALLRTLRAFAAAGIPNQVVAVFDNDTAAADVLFNFRTAELPPNIHVINLPDLPIARSYPTVGPTGVMDLNVNGMAGAIEMYFGEDVLMVDDALMPVQWKGYVSRLDRYQAELFDKKLLQERFGSKVQAALSDPNCIPNQDWSGMRAVFNRIFGILAASV